MSTTRFSHIDSLRAIAALLVVWMHTSEQFVLIATPSIQDRLHDFAALIDVGRIGVVIFFAVSGFVIPSSLRGERRESCREFLIKRLFRLYPVYWFSIPFGLITFWYIWGKEISLSSILWNLTMLQEAMGHPSVQGQYWTLQTELAFYVLCVVLFVQGVLRSPLVLIGLIFAFSTFTLLPLLLDFVGHPLSVTPDPTLTMLSLHLSIMFWGALFRMWYDKQAMPLLAKWSVFGFVGFWMLFALVAIVYYLKINSDLKVIHFFIPYAIGILTFLLLATVCKLNWAWLAWLGAISYSLYLFHPVVMYSMVWVIKNSHIEWIQHWYTGAYMAVALLGTVAMSALTYKYIELPAIRMGNALARRSRTPLQIVPQAGVLK
ncbi:acyltransferase family protein [Pseudomonas sp. Pseusp122]|uniref:acyltransferase family protein n=1 Tax=unclassified Pseudomonas TaxID=196821 RepID=UPI0039A4972F